MLEDRGVSTEEKLQDFCEFMETDAHTFWGHKKASAQKILSRKSLLKFSFLSAVLLLPPSGEAFHVVPVLVAVRRGRVNPGFKTWSRYFTAEAEGPLHPKYRLSGWAGAGWV